jgi:hypothetical protein
MQVLPADCGLSFPLCVTGGKKRVCRQLMEDVARTSDLPTQTGKPRMTKYFSARTFGLCLAGLVLQSAVASTPLAMTYTITPRETGVYTYKFALTLDNHDDSWTAGTNFNWIIFGDGYPVSTLPDFVGDVGSLQGAPFSEFLSSNGANNGPTLLSYMPTLEAGGWVPLALGEVLSWSGQSAYYVEQGNMLFSNLKGSPDNPAYFELAILQGVPESPTLTMVALGCLAVGAVARRRHVKEG